MAQDKKPHGRPSKYQPLYEEALLAHMAKGYSFESFAGVIGVNQDTLYEWAKVHQSFSEAKKNGEAAALRWWEGLLRGGAGGRLPNFSASATIFAMKNKFPKLYRDRIDVQADMKIEETGMSALSEKEKAAILQTALQAKLKKIKDTENE